MGNITSGYGQGTSFTNVSGPTGMDVSPYLAALLQREQQFMSQRSQPQMAQAGNPMGRRTSSVRMAPAREGSSGVDYAQERILNAKAQQAEAQSRAASGRVPTRMSTVGGQTFATPDHLAMTGAQRQAFLPNNAQQIGSPDDEISREEMDFLARMRAGRSRGPGEATR